MLKDYVCVLANKKFYFFGNTNGSKQKKKNYTKINFFAFSD